MIDRELGRCGLQGLQTTWARIARSGFCTMDPSLGRWLKLCLGEQVGEPWVGHTLRLDKIFRQLFPNKGDILKNQHDAGYDAIMTRMIYVEALRRARELTNPSPDPSTSATRDSTD